MSWTGGFTNASASLDFAASGGIPITGLMQGGALFVKEASGGVMGIEFQPMHN